MDEIEIFYGNIFVRRSTSCEILNELTVKEPAEIVDCAIWTITDNQRRYLMIIGIAPALCTPIEIQEAVEAIHSECIHEQLLQAVIAHPRLELLHIYAKSERGVNDPACIRCAGHAQQY